MNLEDFSEIELLRLQASATKELMRRGVVRTRNNPLGDYTEWLVANAIGLDLAANSKLGYDGVSAEGLRYQIKGRRVTSQHPSRQLSAIRKYNEKEFDFLAAVIFDESFDIIEALLIPHDVVGEYARFQQHVNAHNLILKGPILNHPRVRSIKEALGSR